MRTTAAGVPQRGPRRWHPGDPAAPIRRGELTAALATVTVLAGLLLVPTAALVSVILLAAGRACRWPPRWLLVPLVAGAGSLAAAGPGRALAALAAGPGQLATALARAAGHPSRLLGYPALAAATAARWPPRELPLLLAAGAAGAGLLAALRVTTGRRSRAGLFAAARRRRVRALLSAGETVTDTGCAVGLAARTGRIVDISWSDASRGVLLTGTDRAEFGPPAQALACAALRRRKTVLALGPGAGQAGCAAIAARLGLQVTWSREPDGAVLGRAIRARSVLLAAGPGLALLDEAVTLLGWLEQRGLRGDCLLWLTGCEAADPGRLAELLALGPQTGTAVLLSTASPACAAALAPCVRLTLACGPVSPHLAARLVVTGDAADQLAQQRPGAFTIIGPDGIQPGCHGVPIAALALTGRGRAASAAGPAPVAADRR